MAVDDFLVLHLTKTHKLGNPGRLIVPSCGAPTEGISCSIDHHISPSLRKIPSYIKDLTDFLLKLKDITNLPLQTILVTLDLKPLHTNIPHNEGIEPCRLALEMRKVLRPPTEDSARLIEMILTKNNLTFIDHN